MAVYVFDIDALRRFFAERGDRPWPRGGTFALHKEDASGAPIYLEVAWNAEHRLVLFVLPLAIRVTAATHAPLARRIGEINADLGVTGFEIKRDAILFRTHALLNHDGSLSTEVAARTVDACAGAVNRYAGELRELAGPEGNP